MEWTVTEFSKIVFQNYNKLKIANKNKIVALILLVYSFLMTYLHSFNSVRFGDAAIYSDNAVFYLIGKALLKGQVLYKDIFDHKTPYVYFINAFAALFDKNHLGLFVITSLVLFVSLYFTYKIVNLIINDKIYSLVSAALICLFLNNANMTLGFLRTEGYVVALVLPSAYLFIRFLLDDKDSFDLSEMFIIGLLAGLTLMINLKAAILYVPFAFAVASVLKRHKNFKNIARCFAFGLLGVVITIIPFIAYLLATKSVKEAFDAITYVNAIYSSNNSSIIALDETRVETVLTVFQIHPIITAVIIVSLISIIVYRIQANIRIPVLLSYILCLLYTIFLNRPYTYYYTVVIPFIIPFCLIVYDLLYKKIKANALKNLVATLLVIAFFIINIPIGYSVIGRRYNKNLVVKNTLEEMLAPHIKIDENTKVLSYGFGPEYYIYLNSNLAFKYFIIPNIKFDYYSEPYLKQIQYVKEALPDVLIFNFGNYTVQLPSKDFNEFKDAVTEHYQYLGKLNTSEEDVRSANVLIKKK